MLKPSDYVRKGWCQRYLAVDDDGMYVSPTGRDACKWCLYGSIAAAYPEDFLTRVEVVDKVTKGIGTGSLANWNDEPGRTQAQVINLLESIGQ
jgi:hypothetical protein